MHHLSLLLSARIKEKVHHFFDYGHTSSVAEWRSTTNQQPKPKLNSSVSIWLLFVCQAFHVECLLPIYFIGGIRSGCRQSWRHHVVLTFWANHKLAAAFGCVEFWPTFFVFFFAENAIVIFCINGYL